MARRKKKKGKTRSFLTKGGDYYDYNLVVSIILLTTFGLIMLYSTSAYSAQMNVDLHDDMFYFKKQAVVSVVAFFLAIAVSNIDYHFLKPFASTIFVISNLLLIATQFIGTELNGAKRWIYIGPVSFQPAELAKLAIIIYIPVMISKMGRHMKELKSLVVVLITGLMTAFLTFFFTDNLSTAIIVAGITVGMVFIVYPRVKPFLVLGGIAAGIVAIAIFYAKNMMTSGSSFRLRRIAVWLDPETYSNQGGYQVMQGLYAIGSGGFFGKGLGNSLQKLDYVPEAQNDMIFTIICEELGLFGAIILTLLFVFMLYRLFFIAQNAPDLLGSLMASGIFIHIALQVVMNIAVVTNAVPTTGITLPFVSYGGTSVLFLMMEMALALSISKQIRFKEK